MLGCEDEVITIEDEDDPSMIDLTLNSPSLQSTSKKPSSTESAENSYLQCEVSTPHVQSATLKVPHATKPLNATQLMDDSNFTLDR